MPDNTTPVICYDNLLEQGTFSGDGTNPENAIDWYTHDAWTTGAANGYLRTVGSGMTCDYYAVAGHDIYSQTGDCKMQYWTGAAYADCPGSAFTPTDDGVFIVTFPPRTADRFQFIVQNLDAASDIAVVSFGQLMQFEVGVTAGYVPPRFGRSNVIYNAGTQDGAYLGRSVIRSGITGTLALAHIDEDWARTDLDDFIEASDTQGWFLLWSPTARPSEAAYCWTTKTPVPQYEDIGFMSIQIPYEGIVE